MNKLRKTQLLIMLAMLVLNCFTASPASAALQSKFSKADFVSGIEPELDLFLHDRDEVINLKGRNRVRFAVRPRKLYKSKDKNENFKVELYERLPGDERVFIGAQTIVIKRGDSGPAIFNMDLNRFYTNYKDLEVKLYDTNKQLVNTYQTTVSAINLDAQGQSVAEEIPAADCNNGVFDECQLDYLFSRITFEARPQNQISSRVIKQEDGNYTVTFPVSKKRYQALDGDNLATGSAFATEDVVANGSFMVSPEGPTLRYDNDLQRLEFLFSGKTDPSYVFYANGQTGFGVDAPNAWLDLKAGDTTHAPLKFNESTLITSAEAGSVEWDGEHLFITDKFGIKQAFAYETDVLGVTGTGGSGSGDVTNSQLPDRIENKTLHDMTINGVLSITTGSPGSGKFLTADANGLVSWAIPSGGGNGNGAVTSASILATALAGYAVNGSESSIQSLSTSTTILNGFALLERNAQIDRANITASIADINAIQGDLNNGNLTLTMAGEVTGAHNGNTLNGLALFSAHTLSEGNGTDGSFTAGSGAETITNGDTIISAFEKIAGNIDANESNIATNTSNISSNNGSIATNTAAITANNGQIALNRIAIAALQSNGGGGNGGGLTSLAGDVIGDSNGDTTLNGLALFAKTLSLGNGTDGSFTAGSGAETISNGDTIIEAFEKIAGNIDANELSISNFSNGDATIPVAGDITGNTGSVSLNGLALFAKTLASGNGSSTFTVGGGGETILAADTLIEALEKIAGNIDANESAVSTNSSNISTNAGLIATNISNITANNGQVALNRQAISDLENGDTAVTITLSGAVQGTSSATTLNGVALFAKTLASGNGTDGSFTIGSGGETITNGDTIFEALEKIVGNIDTNEAGISANNGQVALNRQAISDLENGDTAVTITLSGAVQGTSSATTLNGVALFAKTLASGNGTDGSFTIGSGAETITNGDTIFSALEKIVGNIDATEASISTNTTNISSNNGSIATNTLAISNFSNGDSTIPVAGDITGNSGTVSLNGLALFAKTLSLGNGTDGSFTAGAGAETITNGDSIIEAFEKLAGNIDANEANIATNTTNITANNGQVATNRQAISDIANGDTAISTVMNGAILGTNTATTFNGIALFAKTLASGNGTDGSFTVGGGAETVTNGDTLIEALQKIAGNIDQNESDISTNTTNISSNNGSIATNTQAISDFSNGDSTIPLAGEITGNSGAATINGLALFAKIISTGNGTDGSFTPGSGEENISNGDTIFEALEKIQGNFDFIDNGGLSLAFAGEVQGYLNGATLNGLSMFTAHTLSEGNGTDGSFTPGGGGEAISNGDNIIQAFEKIAGNIDTNEAAIATNVTNISSNNGSIATNTSNIAANTQNISDLANGDDAFTSITLFQTGNGNISLTHNGNNLEVNGQRVVTANEMGGVDPVEAINVINGTTASTTINYTNVDSNGTAATAIRITSDRVGGQTVTLTLGTPVADLVPTSYEINGKSVSFGTVPDSAPEAFTIPNQDFQVYVDATNGLVKLINIDPLGGIHGTNSYIRKTVRVEYEAFN